MRAAVTGGAGFIGHHLVAALVDRGDPVTVLDSEITGNVARLDAVRDQIRWISGDVRDRRTVLDAVRDADVIFHLAALPSVQRSVVDPVLTNEINVAGTIQVMEAAAEARVRRVVMASSSSVYGNSLQMPRLESQELAPQSPYAVSKAAAELYTRSLGALRGVETVVLRFFNVFGPGQDPRSQYAAVVPRFISAALNSKRPTVNGDGWQSRDFTFVENVVNANLQAADRLEAAGGVYNVGTGVSHTLQELLEVLQDLSGQTVNPRYGPVLPGDVRESRADISRARRDLGYEVTVDFVEGMRRTLASFARGSASGIREIG